MSGERLWAHVHALSVELRNGQESIDFEKQINEQIMAKEKKSIINHSSVVKSIEGGISGGEKEQEDQ